LIGVRWLQRAGTGIRGQVLWGVIDQGCSSAVNFGLTVVAARLLGPEGVGAVCIGFTVYLVALGLLSALVGDPLVVS
jgi:O-antigen/teichoic acid export membrane protein